MGMEKHFMSNSSNKYTTVLPHFFLKSHLIGFDFLLGYKDVLLLCPEKGCTASRAILGHVLDQVLIHSFN